MKFSYIENYEFIGTRLPITTYPAPILKKVAMPVVDFNDELKSLVTDMLFTMYQSPGIGLAAPQVGVSLRLFVLDIWYEREKVTLPDGSTEHRYFDFKPMVFINPKFKNSSGEIIHEEGCLSVPGIYEDVKRAEFISVDYQDINGNFCSLDADELLSVCLQHENDHLDGIVFIERLSFLKKQLIEKKIMKKQKNK
jgi:peptide deformylase